MTIRTYCNLSKENYTILTSQQASTTKASKGTKSVAPFFKYMASAHCPGLLQCCIISHTNFAVVTVCTVDK